jgi:hypothetical protein
MDYSDMVARWVLHFHPLALDDLITELRRLQIAKDLGNADEVNYHSEKVRKIAHTITNPIF